nr:hypothetical protein CFP56_56492 [Quercus suber]
MNRTAVSRHGHQHSAIPNSLSQQKPPTQSCSTAAPFVLQPGRRHVQLCPPGHTIALYNMPSSRHLNPCSYLPRRLQIVATLSAFVIFCILFLGTAGPADYDRYASKVPLIGPQLQEGARQVVQGAHHVVDRLPNTRGAFRGLNIFSAPAHKPPPVQANSSSGEASWHSDWSWRNPFSSSITLDEERAVLPPLKERPPVYTYFDATGRRKDDVSRRAEQELLQIWRKAWWAQGFKPVVLGRAEATSNPLYRTVQALELRQKGNPNLESEMMRWLAWSSMGTGILANWLVVPMAPFEDPFLSFLRQGVYSDLTHYDELDDGLFVGNRKNIERALKAAIEGKNVLENKSIVDGAPPGLFRTDAPGRSIAFYSHKTIAAKYAAINAKLADPETRSEGLAMLPVLVNSHLHTTWQNTFSSGISVLKPLPQHTTTLVLSAIDIARNLSQCPESPIPTSCPPNYPRCEPCDPAAPLPISHSAVFRNKSSLFTIGTVPHPYTITSLLKQEEVMDPKFIRRQTTRDSWIDAATRELSAGLMPSYAHLPALKDAVASDFGAARSFWLTAENLPTKSSTSKVYADDLEALRTQLDWALGFTFPRQPLREGSSKNPASEPGARPPPPPPDFGDGPEPSSDSLIREATLIARARAFIMPASRPSSFRVMPGYRNAEAVSKTRAVIEAWNLADTEIWKFVRAWNARRTTERLAWEEEEEVFLRGGVLGRLIDKVL